MAERKYKSERPQRPDTRPQRPDTRPQRSDSRFSARPNSRPKTNVVQQFSALPRIYSNQIKGSRFNLRRQPLDPIPVHGTVSHWDETGFGFLQPDVNLEKLEGYTGKVFVHKNDLKFGMEKLEKDDRVTFLLYRDSKGVGAHGCCLMEDEDKEEGDDIVPMVTMLIPNKLLPRLIGRKGETINALSDDCDVQITIHNDKNRENRNQLQLVAINGNTENLLDASKEICKQLTASSASQSKMIFIIPAEQTGRFIGVNGIGIKRIVESHRDVSVSISKITVHYQNTEFNKIILFGPQPKVAKCLNIVVPKLSALHSTIMRDYMWGRKRTIINSANQGPQDIGRPTERRPRSAPRSGPADSRFKKFNNRRRD